MIKWPFYPLFLASYVVLGVYTINMDEVRLTEVIQPLLIAIIGTALIIGLLWWKWHEWGALMAAAVVFVMILPYLWAYGRVTYIILGVTGFLLTVYLLHHKGQVSALIKATPYLNFVCLTLLLPFVGSFVIHISYLRQATLSYEAVPLISENKPDIYYIIIDRYARSDILESNFDLDNSAFLDALRSQGFYIADQSYANYNSTSTSLYSGLNMEYVPVLPSHSAVYDGLQKSRVSRSLKEAGYTLVRMGSWWAPTSHSGYVDLNFNCLSATSLSSVVWEWTLPHMLSTVYDKVQGTPPAIWENANYKWEKISEVAQMPEPTFTFAHFLTCHSPYSFNADGSPNYREGEPPGAYQDGVVYTNSALLKMLEDIPSDAIVIIQGDHGPYANEVPAKDWTLKEYQQQYAILNAIRIPGTSLYPSISPVNTFRVMFNTQFGTNLEFLPDKSMQWSPGTSGVEVNLEGA